MKKGHCFIYNFLDDFVLLSEYTHFRKIALREVQMSNNILETLFTQLTQTESLNTNKNHYEKIKECIIKTEKSLTESLDDQQLKLLNELTDLITTQAYSEAQQAYIIGCKRTAKLLVELFLDTSL